MVLMYSIVEIAGKQFRISEEEQVRVPRLPGEVGEKVTFDRVMFLSSENGVKVGNPTLPKARVEATILEHGRDKKVIVFKKKRRKGYRVKKGHRQGYSVLKIDKIALI